MFLVLNLSVLFIVDLIYTLMMYLKSLLYGELFQDPFILTEIKIYSNQVEQYEVV